MMASRMTRLTLPHQLRIPHPRPLRQLRIPHHRPLHHLHDLSSVSPIRMFQQFSSQSTNENAPGPRDPTNETPSPKTPSNTGNITNDQFTMLEARLQGSLEKSVGPLKDSIKEIQTWIRWIIGTFSVGIMLKLVFYDSRIEERGMKRQVEMEGRLTERQVEMEERLAKTQERMEERLTKTQGQMEERLTKTQGQMEERLTKTQGQMEERLTKTIQNSITQLKLELKLENQEETVSRSNRSWWN